MPRPDPPVVFLAGLVVVDVSGARATKWPNMEGIVAIPPWKKRKVESAVRIDGGDYFLPYPEGSRRIGETEIPMTIIVNEEGLFYAIEKYSGAPERELLDAATAAMRYWKFRPATRKGRPVACYHRLSVTFQ